MQYARELPLVTVGMTSYRHAKYIGDAIESVLDQTYQNIELIVSIDYCDDGSVEIAQDYARKYKNKVFVQVHNERLGASGNAQSLLPLVRGDLFCWFASDDLMHRSKIEEQVQAFLDSPDIVACYHDMQLFDDASGKDIAKFNVDYPMHRPLEGDVAKDLVSLGCFIGANAYMVRSDVLRKIEFPHKVPRVSDWLLLIEIALLGDFKFINKPLMAYRIHTENLSRVFDISYEKIAYDWLSNREGIDAEDIRKGLIRLYFCYAFHYFKRKELSLGFASVRQSVSRLQSLSDLGFFFGLLFRIMKQKCRLFLKSLCN